MNPRAGRGMGPTLGEKLKQSRQAVGLSTRAVAERIKGIAAVSHATIANYEKDASRPPVDVLAAMAGVYQRPINWYLGDGPMLRGVRYRNLKSKVGVRARQQFEGEVQRWLDAYVAIERHLNMPLEQDLPAEDSPLARFEADPEEPPRKTAARLREALDLDDDAPVMSVIDILEQSGVRTLEIDTDLAIDGMAATLGEEHVVILAHDSSADRARLTAAHELGHIIRGDCKDGHESKAEERAAFEFASHLLLTSKMLAAAFKRKSVVDLVRFKERYGISLAAMVYRAQEEHIIREDEAKRLWIAFAQRGWKTKEPGRVMADRPNRFESLIAHAVAEKQLTFKALADIGGVREHELRHRLDMALNAEEVLEDEETTTTEHRLRLVR